ncbi:MAG: 2-dehydropantoate 2-reductase [Tepidisphaeraceae bacterium]
MSLSDPVIAVIGAGAVGGYYGARLAQRGHRVHLLTRADCRHIRQSGMIIHSLDGDFSLLPSQIHAYDDPRQLPKADLVIVTLKTTANGRLRELAGPVLKPDSVILTLQNGLGNEELLAELFGRERVLGGMAFVCINRPNPGEIFHTDHGVIRLGEPFGIVSQRAKKIAELFNSSQVKCEVLEDLTFGRWDKLVWNVPFNGLGAALDLTTDQIVGNEHGLRLARHLMQEVIAAAQPLGVRFNLTVIEEKIQHTQTMGAYKTSMQIDRLMHRPMEVEAIIGNPLKVARSMSIATPYMEMLYDTLLLIGATKMD